MKIFFVRHGQTEGNTKQLMQGGGSDAPLTELGCEQAKELGKALRAVPFDVVYTSHQERARKTASWIMAENSYPPVETKVSRALREMDFGKYEAEPIQLFIKEGRFQLLMDEEKAHDIGAETFADVTHRMEKQLQEIVDSHVDNVLVVSHGMALLSILEVLFHASGQPMPEEVLRNASLSVVDIKDNIVKILLFNHSFAKKE